jgi:hypothetical protein
MAKSNNIGKKYPSILTTSSITFSTRRRVRIRKYYPTKRHWKMTSRSACSQPQRRFGKMTKLRETWNKMSANSRAKTLPNSIQIAPRETPIRLKYAGREAGRRLARGRIKLVNCKKN